MSAILYFNLIFNIHIFVFLLRNMQSHTSTFKFMVLICGGISSLESQKGTIAVQSLCDSTILVLQGTSLIGDSALLTQMIYLYIKWNILILCNNCVCLKLFHYLVLVFQPWKVLKRVKPHRKHHKLTPSLQTFNERRPQEIRHGRPMENKNRYEKQIDTKIWEIAPSHGSKW